MDWARPGVTVEGLAFGWCRVIVPCPVENGKSNTFGYSFMHQTIQFIKKKIQFMFTNAQQKQNMFAILPNNRCFPSGLVKSATWRCMNGLLSMQAFTVFHSDLLQPSTSHCSAYKLPVKHLCLVAPPPKPLYFRQSRICTDIITRSWLYTLSWIFLSACWTSVFPLHSLCVWKLPVTMVKKRKNSLKIAHVCEALELKGNNQH